MAQKQVLNFDPIRSSHAIQWRGKISPYHISCAPEFLGCAFNILSNPYDLRPAVNITLKAIDERLAAMPSDKPLVILAGENHTMPSHKIYQQLLAEALLKRGDKIAMAFETDHNTWSSIATRQMNRHVPSWLTYYCSEYDKDGTAGLSAMVGYKNFAYAPKTYDLLFEYCFQNIASVFNDAACLRLPFGGSLLDLNDPCTAKAAKDYGTEEEYINTLSIDGINIRNAIMAQRGVSYAQKTGARILIQTTGLIHLFGDDNCSYQKSLCETYKRAGAEILPVLTTYTKKDGQSTLLNVPEEALPTLQKSVVIEGLAQDEFYLEKYAKEQNLPFNEGAEEAFIERLYAHSGNPFKFHKASKHYLSQLARYYSGVLEDTAKNPDRVIDHPSPLGAHGKIKPRL